MQYYMLLSSYNFIKLTINFLVERSKTFIIEIGAL